jgi:hypothetical protein
MSGSATDLETKRLTRDKYEGAWLWQLSYRLGPRMLRASVVDTIADSLDLQHRKAWGAALPISHLGGKELHMIGERLTRQAARSFRNSHEPLPFTVEIMQ